MLSRAMTLLLVFTAVAGCGFQLRSTGLAEGLTYQLVSEQNQSAGYTDFQRVLKATLDRAGVREASPADMTLRISDFQTETLDGAVNAQLRVAENISTVALVLSIVDDAGNVLADELILEQREAYRMDRAQLLGSYEQQTVVEQNLNQELADQILRALGVVVRSRAMAAGTAGRSIESDTGRDAP